MSQVRNRRVRALPWLVALAAVMLFGCAPKTEESAEETAAIAQATADSVARVAEAAKQAASTTPVKPATPPEHIEVQHVLVGFQGSIPGKTITRTKEESEKLANEILERARRGENFDALVQKYTDDQFPGVYALANNGVTPDQAKQEYGRGNMVPGFSDTAFELSPGNIGMASYDAKRSPYGWHIIKRLN